MEQFSRRQGFRLMLGAAQAVLLGAAGCPSGGYAATVTGIPGLLAYWTLGVQTSIVNEVAGGNDGTYDATPNPATGLPSDSNGATAFTGTQAGTIPNDASMQLAAFSLSLWFTVADPDRTNNILISKDDAGFDNGDFALYTLPGGILRVSFQSDDASHLLEVPGIEANTPYHVVVTANASGFNLWLNGQLVGTDNEHVIAWTLNTNDLKLGTVFWTGNRLIGTLDEIALYDGVIADSDIVALSQLTSDPVSVNGATSAQEGTTVVLDTIDLCTFVGRKSDLTVQVWDGNSWESSAATTHGTASVDANNDLQFVAGSVTTTQSDSFDYRITDANGTSASSTVLATIQDVPTGGSDVDHLINFFPASSGDTVVVSSMSALVSAVNSAPPGRHILIAAGTYTGGTQTFVGSGTIANPIVVRPQGARGTVTLTKPIWTVDAASTSLVFTNLYFTNPGFNIYGTNTRISRCRFRGIDFTCINWYGLNTRVDHNDISDYLANANTKYFVRFTGAAVGGLLYDHNYFHDYDTSPSVLDSCLFSTSSVWDRDFDVWVDHCLWQNIVQDNRILTVKNSGFVVRFCTFDNIKNTLQQRQGGGWEIRSCWFESLGTDFLIGHDDSNAPGQEGQLIIGNRFKGGIGFWVASGNVATGGPDNSNPTIFGQSYHRSVDGRAIGNILDTGTIYVGRTWASIEAAYTIYPAVDSQILANTRNGAPATTSNGIFFGLNQTGTVISSTTSESYTPAVKLTSSDVGMAAADPFCPSGPQS